MFVVHRSSSSCVSPLCSFFAVMIAVLPFAESGASAQEAPIIGVVVADVTAESACSLTYQTLEGDAVVDELAVPCPAGSVIRTTALTVADADGAAGLFVPLGGDAATDAAAIQEAQLSLAPPAGGWSYAESQAEMSTAGCVDRSFRANHSWQAYDPGVTVYSTVYYSQDFTCQAYLGSSAVSLSWDANVYWERGGYTTPAWRWSHNCQNLSTYGTSQRYEGDQPRRPVLRLGQQRSERLQVWRGVPRAVVPGLGDALIPTLPGVR